LAGQGVAPVFLEVVDAPGGVLAGVLVLVADGAGAAGAGLGADVGVDAELEALGVDVVGERLDAGGEAGGMMFPWASRPLLVAVMGDCQQSSRMTYW
jgi:hypothetical protein